MKATLPIMFERFLNIKNNQSMEERVKLIEHKILWMKSIHQRYAGT